MAPQSDVILSAHDLCVEFLTDDGVLVAVQDLSVDLHRGEVLGVVGESGCGKTVSWLAIMGLLPRVARMQGEVAFRGRSLSYPDDAASLRGREMAMVFQDAQSGFHPLKKVGDQIGEAIWARHPRLHRQEVRDKVVELLDLVGIRDPATRALQHPHQYSGGMRQRAMIAMAIANEPSVLIADEPTTALDMLSQANVLAVLDRIRNRTGCALVLITHDLGIVQGVADRVLVMYAGRVVEVGTVDDVFGRPQHPYTAGLLGSLPRLEGGAMRMGQPLPGQPPSAVDIPTGCSFHPRCPLAHVPHPCATDLPELHAVDEPAHLSACHFREGLQRVSGGPVGPSVLR